MTHYPADTVLALLASGADTAPAIGAPKSADTIRPPLTHGELRALAGRTIAELNSFGIGRNDRVAMVVPNGPEMAAGFIAIACGATTAPPGPNGKRCNATVPPGQIIVACVLLENCKVMLPGDAVVFGVR